MNTIKVMIVDDHQIIIDGIKSLLNGVNEIEVIEEAINGKQAIEKIAGLKVDIVLMDIDMPLINGCEATRFIIKKYPEIKIIALTMFNEKTVIREMLNAGASGYILKNTGKNEILNAIFHVYNGNQYLCNEIQISLTKPLFADNLTHNSTPLNCLSGREVQVLTLLSKGLTNIEISKKLFISRRTVDTHRTNIMKKLNVHNVASLIKYAIDNGII